MRSSSFTVRCRNCDRSIAIHSVAEFRTSSGLGGYSYGYHCECGCCVAVDGCDGDGIPESLKLAAAKRRNANLVLTTIDFHRRSMPQSDGKVALKSTRLNLPAQLSANEWLVYRMGDAWSVTYSTETEAYSLRHGDYLHTFSDINELTANLPGG